VDGSERLCVCMKRHAAANAFVFTCAGGACAANGLRLAEVCDLQIAVGVSEQTCIACWTRREPATDPTTCPRCGDHFARTEPDT